MSLRTTPLWVRTSGPFEPSPGNGPAVSSGMTVQSAAAAAAARAGRGAGRGRGCRRRRGGGARAARREQAGADAAEPDRLEHRAAGQERLDVERETLVEQGLVGVVERPALEGRVGSAGLSGRSSGRMSIIGRLHRAVVRPILPHRTFRVDDRVGRAARARARGPTRIQASTGWRRPLTDDSPSATPCRPGPSASQVARDTVTSPGSPRDINRDAVFVVSPITAKLRRPTAPTLPTTAVPVLTPARKIGQPGWVAAIDRPAATIASGGPRRAIGVVGLLGRRVEGRHDPVAGELLDHAAVRIDDRHDDRPVRVQHLDHDRRRPGLAERREAREIGEEDADPPLDAAQTGAARLVDEAIRDLRREVRPEEPVEAADLAGGLLDEGDLVAARAVAAEVVEDGRRRARRAPRRPRPRRSPGRATGRAGRASRRGTARRTPPSAIRSGGTRSAPRRRSRGTRASIRTCHSHQLSRQFRLRTTATIASPRSTSATPIARITMPPRRR